MISSPHSGFAIRKNSDCSLDVICLKCYVTAGTTMIESELPAIEQAPLAVINAGVLALVVAETVNVELYACARLTAVSTAGVRTTAVASLDMSAVTTVPTA